MVLWGACGKHINYRALLALLTKRKGRGMPLTVSNDPISLPFLYDFNCRFPSDRHIWGLLSGRRRRRREWIVSIDLFVPAQSWKRTRSLMNITSGDLEGTFDKINTACEHGFIPVKCQSRGHLNINEGSPMPRFNSESSVGPLIELCLHWK